MFIRPLFNSKPKDNNVRAHQNSNNHQKENDQKNLNRKKRTTSNLPLKPIDIKNYQTNAESKLNQSLSFNSVQPSNELKGISTTRHHLQKLKIEAQAPNEKRKTNTEQYCQLYGKDIIRQSQLVQCYKGDFLKEHQINTFLRARMLDWMVEVIKSYKFISKTYFSGVNLMDRYLAEIKERVTVPELHILGVTSMYIATKMDEIYPLKIKTVYEKIVHKKIQKERLCDMQARMFEVLGYKVNSWTFFDLACLKLADEYQSQVSDLRDKMEDIISFISKVIMYDYEIYTRYDQETLARVVLRIAARIFHLAVKSESESVKICFDDVTSLYKNFKVTYKGLTNIFKFSDERIINLVDNYFFEEEQF